MTCYITEVCGHMVILEVYDASQPRLPKGSGRESGRWAGRGSVGMAMDPTLSREAAANEAASYIADRKGTEL